MPDTKQRSVWQFDGHVAVLRAGCLSASIDPTHPDNGIHGVRVDKQAPVSAKLLGVRLEPDATNAAAQDSDRLNVRETYVRGVDLVAAYPQTPGAIAAAQIYWRAIVPDGGSPACGVEMIASIQTSLLESHPTFTSVTEIDAVAVLRLDAATSDHFSPLALVDGEPVRCAPDGGPGAYLLRLPGSSFSYVEMIYPGDFLGTTVAATWPSSKDEKQEEAQRRFTLTSTLFPERLEKGVIRRGRLAGIFVPCDGDEQAAARFYRQWIASPPPLTA